MTRAVLPFVSSVSIRSSTTCTNQGTRHTRSRQIITFGCILTGLGEGPTEAGRRVARDRSPVPDITDNTRIVTR